MRLEFPGTRGEIALRSRRHTWHSVLVISYRDRRLAIDCGLDWQGRLDELHGDAIALTHAHPDHAAGLRDGTDIQVFATAETWAALARYPLERRETVTPRVPFAVGAIELEAFRVEHSLRAPAVAYRVSAGKAAVLYAPDLVTIPDLRDAMRGLSLYVADGASITRPIIRRRAGTRIGHASIREQLDWCAAEGVERAIFSHCGSQIVRDERRARELVAALGRERNVEATLARDGLRLEVRGRRVRVLPRAAEG